MKGKQNCYQAGDKFGKLTIVHTWKEINSRSKRNETHCECICECGNTKTILAYSFRDTRRKFHCGCASRRGGRGWYKPGERFGKLLILKRWTQAKPDGKTKESIVECKCDCGNVVTLRTRYLANAKKLSCGCLQHQKNKDNPNWKGYGEISGSVWGSIQNSACKRSRKINFDITIEQIWDLFQKQRGICALSGVKLEFAIKNRRYGGMTTASLDRIDSNKGYAIDNVQWVHKDVNLMKWHLSQETFINWCRLITANQPK